MKHTGTFTRASTKLLIKALIVSLFGLVGCSASKDGISLKNPTESFPLPETPVAPIPIPDPEDVVAVNPEAVATKQTIEEVESIQDAANSIPDISITTDDLDLLSQESLIDDPEILKGWVQ